MMYKIPKTVYYLLEKKTYKIYMLSNSILHIVYISNI